MITYKKIEADVTAKLRGMAQRASAVRGFMIRNIYPMYQNAQRERWMTENTSEFSRWEKLDPIYAARKRKEFAEYEGGGTKMLIATGKLFHSVIGPGEGFRMVATNTGLTIATSIEYAPFVNEKRPFREWSPRTIKKMRDAIADFMLKGDER